MIFKKSDSLKKVYYTSFLLLIVIPILLVFGIAAGVLGVMMRDSNIANIKNAQSSMQEMLKKNIREASLQLSHFVYVNSGEFMDLAAATDTKNYTQKNQNTRKLEEAFQVAMTPKQDIVASQFYMKDGEVTSVKDELIQETDEIKKSDWYQKAMKHKNVVSVGAYDTGIQRLTSSRQKKCELILAAALAPDIALDRSGRVELVSLFYRSDIGQQIREYEKNTELGSTVILDENGAVIFLGRSGEAGTWYPQQLSLEERLQDGVYERRVVQPGTGKRREQSFTYVTSTVPVTGWKLLTFVPTHSLTGEFRQVIAVWLGVMIGLFFLFYYFSRYFLRNILTPVQQVVEGMEQVQKGDLYTHIDPAGQNEIRKMIHSFNQMVRTLRSSIKEKETAQEMKHDAEIRALQSQINPHFLVNTLNSIRFMAQVSKFDGIRKMAEALIRIVSCSFRSNISFYSLKEELEVLDSYLYLMKIRYSDGFETRYEIDSNCLQCQVPRLILQPLVENSIVHGFTGEDMGHLCVTAKAEDQMLVIRVRDDGCGMKPEKIEQVLTGKKRDENDNTNIGLENVIERLRLNFGAECRISIQSEPDQYTEITLRLPMVFHKEKTKKTEMGDAK